MFDKHPLPPGYRFPVDAPHILAGLVHGQALEIIGSGIPAGSGPGRKTVSVSLAVIALGRGRIYQAAHGERDPGLEPEQSKGIDR